MLDPQREEQPALERAVYLAKATGSSLHLFLCAFDTAISIATFLTGGQKETFIKTILDGSTVMVERLAKTCQEQGVSVTFDVVWDRHPVEAIVSQCNNTRYDLVMKYARNASRSEVMFNHFDWNLMRYCPHPLMLVKDGQWDKVGQVLAAVDAAPESTMHENLNKSILDRASYLANALDFELHLVSAYPAPPVFAPVSVATEQQINYRSKMRAMVETHLAELASRYDVPDDRIHAREGPVDWIVPEVSKELVAEFVVFGNVSREGNAGLSIGSTAESTLDALNTNVLIVKT